MISDKIRLLASALDVDENILSSETVLSSLDEWDSMGKISLIAMLNKRYGKQLSVDKISDFQFIQDIIDLME